MYGDVFVRGMQTGGRFFAVVEVFTSNKTEQESLSLSLKGSYGPFSAQGSFSSEFSQAISTKSLKITVHHEGGVVPREPTSLEDVQNIAATFAATVEGHAVPYAVLRDKYTILDLPKPPNYIDLQNQLDVLAFCAQQRNIIWTALNNVNFIFANPGQFEIAADQYDMATLVEYRAALETDLLAVKKAASLALDHPRDAALPLLTAKPRRYLNGAREKKTRCFPKGKPSQTQTRSLGPSATHNRLELAGVVSTWDSRPNSKHVIRAGGPEHQGWVGWCRTGGFRCRGRLLSTAQQQRGFCSERRGDRQGRSHGCGGPCP